jgi:hypothetical protein
LFVVLLVMAPPSQELEPPAIPGRFIVSGLGLSFHRTSRSNQKAIRRPSF